MAGHIERATSRGVAIIRLNKPVGTVVMVGVEWLIICTRKVLVHPPVNAGDVAVVVAPAIITELHGKQVLAVFDIVDASEPAPDVVAVGDILRGV